MDTPSLTRQGSGPALAGKRSNVPIDHNPSRLNKPRPQSIVDLRDVQRTRASDTGETNLHPSVGCSCNRMEEELIDFDSEPCPMDEDIDVLRVQLEAEIPTDVDSRGSPRIPTDDVTEFHQRKQALETNWSKARSSFARTSISSQRRSSLSHGATRILAKRYNVAIQHNPSKRRRSTELHRYQHMQTSKIRGANLQASSFVTWAAVTWNIKQSNLECRYGIPPGVGRGTESTVLATRLSWIQMWIASQQAKHSLRKERMRCTRNGDKSSLCSPLPFLSHQKVTLCSRCPNLRICVA